MPSRRMKWMTSNISSAPQTHHGDGDLQAQLQVPQIGYFSDHVRAQAAEQLRGEHVHAHGSGMGAARHHVMKNGSPPGRDTRT